MRRRAREDVGDGVGVPPLRQHRDRDDAADALAEPTFAANRIHDLAQENRRPCLGGGDRVDAALDALAAELLDLGGRHLAEGRIEGLAGFELLAVDQQRVGLRKALAVVVVVAEKAQVADVARLGFAVRVGTLEASDPFVDELGRGGVVADHDEDRGHVDAGALPGLARLLIVAVEGMERRLELAGEDVGERVEGAGLPAPFFGIALPMCSQSSR